MKSTQKTSKVENNFLHYVEGKKVEDTRLLLEETVHLQFDTTEYGKIIISKGKPRM